MTPFELLIVTHLAGDWLFQTEWMAMEKRHNWRALLSHVAVYHALMLAVLGWRFGYGNPRVYAVVAVLAVTHAVLDRGWPVVRFMQLMRISVTLPPEKWLLIAVDQTLHILLLAGAAIALGRG
jgi:hypothetical protein